MQNENSNKTNDQICKQIAERRAQGQPTGRLEEELDSRTRHPVPTYGSVSTPVTNVGYGAGSGRAYPTGTSKNDNTLVENSDEDDDLLAGYK